MALWNPFKKNKDESKSTEEPNQESASEISSDAPAQADATQSGAAQADSPAQADAPPQADAPTAKPEPQEPPKKKGMWGSFKNAFKKTRDVLNTDLRDLFKTEGRLVDDEFLKELFGKLVKTDMGAGPATEIRDRIGRDFRARKVFFDDLVAAAKETIGDIMQQPEVPIEFAKSGPTVVMVCGVNGSGKTTSIAKLTNMFVQDGKSVVLGAGDTFRAAAVEQLTIWAGRLGAEIVTGRQGSDPASVAYQAADFANKNNTDVCIIDTAGRLQTQSNLMQELTKIRNVIKKVIPEAPHEVLLVLDATAGQNAISQARGFSDAAGCTGIVLAKLDGTAKGGVAIPIRREFELPVKYIGLGEKAEDIALFNVDKYIEALFDDSKIK